MEKNKHYHKSFAQFKQDHLGENELHNVLKYIEDYFDKKRKGEVDIYHDKRMMQIIRIFLIDVEAFFNYLMFITAEIIAETQKEKLIDDPKIETLLDLIDDLSDLEDCV